MTIGHNNEARSTNFLFTVGAERDLIFAVQSANINELTMGTSPFPTGAKDLVLPSNKIENSQLSIDILISEDYSEWIEIYKWMLRCKNTNDAHLSQVKVCELVALDAQNQPSTRFIYEYCFPIELGGVNLAVNDTNSNVITADVTFQFNKFKIKTPDGSIIDERYV